MSFHLKSFQLSSYSSNNFSLLRKAIRCYHFDKILWRKNMDQERTNGERLWQWSTTNNIWTSKNRTDKGEVSFYFFTQDWVIFIYVKFFLWYNFTFQWWSVAWISVFIDNLNQYLRCWIFFLCFLFFVFFSGSACMVLETSHFLCMLFCVQLCYEL